MTVCPTGVLDAVPNAIPLIARQHHCRTCSICEFYCPADALYIVPHADASMIAAEFLLQQLGLMGSYRRAVGWNSVLLTTANDDRSCALLALARQAQMSRPAAPRPGPLRAMLETR